MSERQLQLQTVPGPWPLTWPMGLTMLRLLLLPVFLWVMLSGAGHDAGPQGAPGALGANRFRWWAVGIFAVMAATDKLDGYLARRLNQTSRIGTILDPVADKLLIASSVVLLSFDWVAGPAYRIPIIVVAAVYAKDLVVASGTLVLLALAGKVTIAPRVLGKLSTVAQLLLIMLTLIAPDLEALRPRSSVPVLRTLWGLVVAVALAACVDYVGVGVAQFRASRRPAGAGA